MTETIEKPRRIWLRSFYGFNPEEAGYIGWSDKRSRDRMLALVEDNDLFMIYGATTADTPRYQRNKVLGFLQIEARAIRDYEKSSPESQKRKYDEGWGDRWTYALPVTKAWRVDEAISLERIAQKTYRPEAGQAIAVWSPPLLQSEVERALKIKVTEVNVFGEREVAPAPSRQHFLANAFQPSKAFPGGFGERTSVYEDGPTKLYLARFDGNWNALIGRTMVQSTKTAMIKIGVSNDTARRAKELNLGIPPASIGKWKIELVSEPYDGREQAEKAESKFKEEAKKRLRSLGGEFFEGEWITAQSVFSSVPGVSRFGR